MFVYYYYFQFTCVYIHTSSVHIDIHLLNMHNLIIIIFNIRVCKSRGGHLHSINFNKDIAYRLFVDIDCWKNNISRHCVSITMFVSRR